MSRNPLTILLLISAVLVSLSQPRPNTTRRLGIDASNPLGCSAAPSLRILKYLDRICEDCYMIYRDPDVYTMCRNGCFNNRFFLGCMDVMMVSKKTRSRAASFVSMINSPTSR